ncbi:tryptophan 7-halogenase [Rhodopseudomonas palustris]|uniref:NAD(P)/FAD-dependent oxidoreductase n=1 Tax=Rhodopseudomonas palustris TaxID=1076 RepID=UPI002ACE0E23|nr:tryptophan 7-halogenase [Rhodopseudomonas palustris]WQH00606.1 tryptophan 7-halogenase [Rhodopseudomonas palustris]
MDRIAIIGAGVAGLAAARRLVLAGHRPILIAPDSAVPNRGETLSPKALTLLEALQWPHLLDADSTLPGDGRFSVWGDATLRKAPDHEGLGYHLDRAQFERLMRTALFAHDLEQARTSVTAIAHRPACVELTLADRAVISAPAVIDCTGRAALSSGEAAQRRRLDRLIAAWRVLDLPDDAETVAATLVEAVELGWWYMSPLPGRRMMLGLFTDSDLVPTGVAQDGVRWAGLAAGTRAIAPRLASLGLEASAAETPPAIAPAASITVGRLVEGRIVRAGDAAAALDPIGANGLATALWSGTQAAGAALGLARGDADAGAAYERDYLQGVAHQFAAQNAMYASEQRFADAPFWRRRQIISSEPDPKERTA